MGMVNPPPQATLLVDVRSTAFRTTSIGTQEATLSFLTLLSISLPESRLATRNS